MAGLKWYVRHLWIKVIRYRNKMVAKAKNKKPVTLEVQSLQHGFKSTIREK